jgi:uncharacterized protein YbjT (DUF2867 family)
VADGGPSASSSDQHHGWKSAVPIPLVALVIGATGRQGGAVARRLLERGHRVRVFARSADSSAGRELERLGAKVWIGSFDDPDSLWRAARGVDAVFAMSTPLEAGFEAEVRQGSNVLEAAKAAGVGHLVYSSVAGADRGTGIPHFETKAELERQLAGLDLPHTILAPVDFMERLGSGLRGLAGRLDALGDTRVVDRPSGCGTIIPARVPLGPNAHPAGSGA